MGKQGKKGPAGRGCVKLRWAWAGPMRAKEARKAPLGESCEAEVDLGGAYGKKQARRAPPGECCEAEAGLGGANVGKRGKKGPAGRGLRG